MLPRSRNSNETRPPSLANGSLHATPFARAGQWLTALSDRVARRNSYIGRLKAAVYADMVGYSRLFRLDDAGTVARLRSMHRMLRPAIRRHHGRLVQTGGDSMLITFDSLAEAVRCAVTMQCALALENDGWPDDRRMLLRVGVDLGDVIVEGHDFHGDGVIVAVRLQEVCPPGGVCISAAVHDRGGDRLGLPFERLGALTLKNIAQPVEAFVLRAPLEGRAGSLRLVQ
jgi:class 3 adenylate cyclase